jgi:acetate kinase
MRTLLTRTKSVPSPFITNRREVEEERNAANEGVISATASRVAVRVIHTDEELMIAKTGCRVLGLGRRKGN